MVWILDIFMIPFETLENRVCFSDLHFDIFASSHWVMHSASDHGVHLDPLHTNVRSSSPLGVLGHSKTSRWIQWNPTAI